MEEEKKTLSSVISTHRRLSVQAFLLESRIRYLESAVVPGSDRPTVHDPLYFPDADEKKRVAITSLKRLRKEMKAREKDILKMSKKSGVPVKAISMPPDISGGDPGSFPDIACRYHVFVIAERSIFGHRSAVRTVPGNP
jgi:hypothetical protein